MTLFLSANWTSRRAERPEATTPFVTLSFQFIETRVLVLHFVHLLREIFLVKTLLEKSQRWFLIYRCHF